MTTLLHLCPTIQRREWDAVERVCEHIEGTAGELFSRPEILNAVGGAAYNAATNVIREYLALGFIERVSGGPGPHPVYYRVLPHALPTAGVR